MPPGSTARIPDALTSGQAAEALALEALKITKNTSVWRPTPEQIRSLAFKSIVGDPRYTTTGLARGTVLDSVESGFSEIKSGSSTLDSTYQLRLQTYRALVENKPLTIYTNRPVDVHFGHWLNPRGVQIEPLPEP
jgi:hypothetical protein